MKDATVWWDNYITTSPLTVKGEEEHEYWLAGEEVGDSGTPHLQIYGFLKKKKTINGIKKLYSDNRIHIEIAYGKHKECIILIDYALPN